MLPISLEEFRRQFIANGAPTFLSAMQIGMGAKVRIDSHEWAVPTKDHAKVLDGVPVIVERYTQTERSMDSIIYPTVVTD